MYGLSARSRSMSIEGNVDVRPSHTERAWQARLVRATDLDAQGQLTTKQRNLALLCLLCPKEMTGL